LEIEYFTIQTCIVVISVKLQLSNIESQTVYQYSRRHID
jgi:hypothetical protein